MIRNGTYARLIATAMAALAIGQFHTAGAAPADVFSSAAPVIGSDAPKGRDIADGDSSVATQTGAFTYQYPIAVPPGRNGMSPHLALSYSSQAALYGGIAAGWNLAIPFIGEDTSQGHLRTHSPEVEVAPWDGRADDQFVSTLAGGQPLIAVTEPTSSNVYRTYRAQNDNSFARYERMTAASPYRWRVYATDGSIFYFGTTSRMLGCWISDGYAPLTTAVDAFGNEVNYDYEPTFDGECRIKSISWGANPGAGIASPFAQVAFGYIAAPGCNGVRTGSARSARTGMLVVTGASKLTTITATAFPPGSPGTPDHTRLIKLTYEQTEEGNGGPECALDHAPIRFLTEIRESAWGTDAPRVDLPAVTFDYGDARVNLASTQTQFVPWGVDVAGSSNLGWGYRRNDDRWPTVESMMLDVDGDGLVDRVYNTSTSTTCQASWLRNRGMYSGHVQFSAPQPLSLPQLKWHRKTPLVNPPNDASPTAAAAAPYLEGCALNGQVTAFVNSVPSPGRCHDQTACQPSGDPQNPGPYCYPGGTTCPSGFDAPQRTYLSYRWLDMDGDGLVDLVASVNGSINTYDIVQGNITTYWGHPEPSLFGAWPACPPNVDRCKALDATCMANARTCTGAACTFNWQAVNACIAAVPGQACENLMLTGERKAYSRCDGLYPWFIYKNTGNGVFASAPIIKYQPVPLESDAGDSSIVGGYITSQDHAIADVDGDGILDAVVHPTSYPIDTTAWWFVWLGDGTGGFGPKRYTFPTRNAPNNHINGVGTVASQFAKSSEGMLDIDGDGLPDHWVATQPNPEQGAANVAFNLATQHLLVGIPPHGEFDTPLGIKPGNDTVASNMVCDGPCGTHPILSGDSTTTNRVVDVDADGRPDVVLSDGPFTLASYNVGGQFGPRMPYLGALDGVRRTIHASQQIPGSASSPLLWQLLSDLIDLDGDGISESAKVDSNTMTRNARDPAAPPPRLMIGMHNGRGAHSTIQYASMHDSAVVEQHPELTWFDGRPKASPHSMWVVKSVSVLDDFPTTTSTVSYSYKNPRQGADDRGRYAFRGFEEITSVAPSGARTIQTYGYAPDWSGRLIESDVVPAEAPGEVRSIDRTSWEMRTLFNGAVATYHPTVVEQLTCANGQTKATCTPAAAPGYTRTTATLTPLASTTTGGIPLLWQVTASLLQAGATTAAADGDRQTVTTYALAADGSTYRLRPLTVTQSHRVAGAMTMYGKSATTWDATYRVPLTSAQWIDAVDANRLIARSVYDMTTGNVLQHFKPKQNVASTTSTAFTYDARKLFVATEVNEVGHRRDYTYEYGTGTRLRTDGPNVRACTTGCPTGASTPVKEQHSMRIDGIGREIERSETTSDDGTIYTLYQTSTTSYVDAATASAPTSVTMRTHLDGTSPVWKQERTDLDGHGRPINSIVFAQGSVPTDQITSYLYRSDGTLAAVAIPDPTANTAATVTYSYTFDSLGRATSVRRPDAAAVADRSGIDITYNGVTRTRSDHPGLAGGPIGSTTTLADRFGRVTQVDELASGTSTFATTRYTFGPDDAVATVVDPQNVTTTLTHDLTGRRTQITRTGNRIWRFTYDANGNTIAEQVPGSTGPLTDANYTTTTAYDDLDRPISKVIGQRALSSADQTAFGNRTETFTWDYGANHTGYLRYAQSFPPSSTTAAVTLDLGNDNQGQRTVTNETLNVAGYPRLFRQFRQTHYLFGGVRGTYFGDQIGGTNVSSSITAYDARLLPQIVQFNRETQPSFQSIETRNVAGLVTKRHTNTTGAMTFAESNWTYDKLGRIASQVVQKGPGPTQVVRQDLAYFGTDDPKTLDHYLGTSRRTFQYAFDLRHELTSTTETTTPGYFTAGYQYGTAGRIARVTEAQTTAPPASDVKPRDVNYVYGGVDPEQVTSLVNVAGGQRYATYTYDLAGNQLTRCYGGIIAPTCAGEAMDYVYDGKDQLRRATKKQNGTVIGSEEYWYDNSGNRVAIVKRDAAGAKTELVWFIGDTEAHYDGAGAVSHVYSNVSLGTPVARIDRTGNTSTTVELQFHGLANNTIAAIDVGGTINASFSYAPFGEVVEATNAGGAAGTAAHRRRSNDKYQDEISALAYYGARYYDKVSLNWTQGDPLYTRAPDAAANPRRANVYAFSLHNPLRYVDPDGLNPAAAPAPGPAAGSIRSEGEIRNRWRKAYEADANWFLNTNGCVVCDLISAFGIHWSAMPGRTAVVSESQVVLAPDSGSDASADLAKRLAQRMRAANKLKWWENVARFAIRRALGDPRIYFFNHMRDGSMPSDEERFDEAEPENQSIDDKLDMMMSNGPRLPGVRPITQRRPRNACTGSNCNSEGQVPTTPIWNSRDPNGRPICLSCVYHDYPGWDSINMRWTPLDESGNPILDRGD